MIKLIMRKVIKLIKHITTEDDINIIYDNTAIDKNNILNSAHVCIMGDTVGNYDLVSKIISEYGGIVSDYMIPGCSKYIYVCDLVSNEEIDDIGCKWANTIDKMKKAFFCTKEFAESCYHNGINGCILHIILSNSNVEPYKMMVQGFGKNIGRYHIRTNAVVCPCIDEEVLKETIIFLIDRHSSHINGIFIELGGGHE